MKLLNKHNGIILMSAGLLISSGMVHAKIYKCENKEGKVYYNDKPCPKNLKESTFKNLKDPLNVPKKDNFAPQPGSMYEVSESSSASVKKLDDSKKKLTTHSQKKLEKNKIGPKVRGTKLEKLANQKRADYLKRKKEKAVSAKIKLPPLPEDIEERVRADIMAEKMEMKNNEL